MEIDTLINCKKVSIYEKTTKLDHYLILQNESIPLDNPGSYSISTTTIEVINGIDAYVALMLKIFDLDQIRDFLSNDYLMAFDALNAVTGPYAKRLLEEILAKRLIGYCGKEFFGHQVILQEAVAVLHWI